MIPGLTGKKGKDHLKKKDKRKWIKQYAKTFFPYFKKPFSTAQEFLLLMSDKRQFIYHFELVIHDKQIENGV